MSTETRPADVLAEFRRWITRSRYAPTSQAAYLAKVTDYLRWLEQAGPDYADALVDPHVRDWAVRDYRRDLMRERRQAVATVELAMAAVGAMYGHLGLGKPEVPRQRPADTPPKCLDDDDHRRLMRAAERHGVQTYAIVSTLYGGCCRVDEAVMLDIDDVFLGDRLGTLHIRHGKGDKQRTVPIGAATRDALRPHLARRMGEISGDPVGAPLFTSRQSPRMSKRRMQSLIADVGREVKVDVSPHDLRHTFAYHYLRDNPGDVVGLKDLYGHASIKTTAGYARPPEAAARAAVESVRRDW